GRHHHRDCRVPARRHSAVRGNARPAARTGGVESATRRMKIPVPVAPDTLDFAALIRAGDTVGWAQATAEPVLLTRLLDRQATRCPPFRLFFALTFASDFRTDHPNVTVTALGGGAAGRRFFAGGAGGVVPANIS